MLKNVTFLRMLLLGGGITTMIVIKYNNHQTYSTWPHCDILW